MIFELAEDFAAALAAMPAEDPCHCMLRLLEEAVRRDIHFVARHPTTLFQCLWNTCWWYDCPQAAEHYEKPEGGWKHAKSRSKQGEPKLYKLLECWRTAQERSAPPGPGLSRGVGCHPPEAACAAAALR